MEALLSKLNGLTMSTVMLLTFGFTLLLCAIIWVIVQAASKEKKEEKDVPLLTLEEETQEKIRSYETVIEAQNQQIAEFNVHMEQYAKLRHDFRQELLLMKEFAKNGDRESLEKYLPQVRLDQGETFLPLCENPLVNTILQVYCKRAKEANVQIDAVVEADNDLWLTASDVGVLFGNLLDNAIVAASQAEEGNRKLRIRTTQTKECFIIAMGNTYGEPRHMGQNGLFTSTKENHKGIGLSSIQSVAKQYDGNAKFCLEDQMFMSYVILLRPIEQ